MRNIVELRDFFKFILWFFVAETKLTANIRTRGENISIKVNHECVTFSSGDFDNLLGWKSFYFLRRCNDLMTPPKAKLTLPWFSTGINLPGLGVPEKWMFGACSNLVDLQTSVISFKLNYTWFNDDLSQKKTGLTFWIVTPWVDGAFSVSSNLLAYR